MSSITAYDKDGKIVRRGDNRRAVKYRARYRTPDGASRSATFTLKIEAEQFLAGIEVKKASGAFVDPVAGRIMFGEYATAWVERQPHRDTTAVGWEVALRKHIIPTFGKMALSAVKTSDVQAWIVAIGRDEYGDDGEVVRRGLSPATIKVMYGKLAAIFRSALDDQLIHRTPCSAKGVRLPREAGGEVHPMTADQVLAIANAVPAHYRALVVLIAGTGLRPGEAIGVTNDRVDWIRRRITVDRQLVTLANKAPAFGPPKNPSSNRTVVVPEDVISILSQHVAEYGLGPDGLLFADDKHDPIRRNALGHAWRRAAPVAGVEAFSWHDLRHYAASVMIDQGASVKAVQKQLGHASATTTLDTYAHLWPDAEDTTRAALSAGVTQFVSRLCHETAVG